MPRKPTRAGIDPENLLTDTEPENNVKAVKIENQVLGTYAGYTALSGLILRESAMGNRLLGVNLGLTGVRQFTSSKFSDSCGLMLCDPFGIEIHSEAVTGGDLDLTVGDL